VELHKVDKYTSLKRRIYLVVFPILFVTNASYWLLSPYLVAGEERNLASSPKTKSYFKQTQLAEILRNIIEGHSFLYVGHITSSFGVSSYQPDDILKTLIKRADRALYMAKNNGRNKVQAL